MCPSQYGFALLFPSTGCWDPCTNGQGWGGQNWGDEHSPDHTGARCTRFRRHAAALRKDRSSGGSCPCGHCVCPHDKAVRVSLAANPPASYARCARSEFLLADSLPALVGEGSRWLIQGWSLRPLVLPRWPWGGVGRGLRSMEPILQTLIPEDSALVFSFRLGREDGGSSSDLCKSQTSIPWGQYQRTLPDVLGPSSAPAQPRPRAPTAFPEHPLRSSDAFYKKMLFLSLYYNKSLHSGPLEIKKYS